MFTKSGRALLPCALILTTLALSNVGVAQLKLYDDFNSKSIDPSKWVGEPPSIAGGSNKDRRESTVELSGQKQDRHLRISQTSYSAITDNNGASGTGFGLGFAVARAEANFARIVALHVKNLEESN
jgi:hypothetical protein